MKKLYVILVLTIFCGARGYCQLLQSNSLGQHEDRRDIKFLPYLTTVSNKPDSMVTIKFEPSFLKALNVAKELNLKINQTAHKISILADSLNVVEDKEKKTLRDRIHALETRNQEYALQSKNAQERIAKLSTENLNLYSQINSLYIDKYKIYLQEQNMELSNIEAAISKNTETALSSFDSVIHGSDAKSQHFIDTVSHSLHLNSYIIQQKLNSLKADRETIVVYFDSLKILQRDANVYSSLKEAIYVSVFSNIRKIDSVRVAFQKAKHTFIDNYNAYAIKANKEIVMINNEIAKKKAEGETAVSDDERLSAIGGITTVLGEHGTVIPNISVVGQKKFVAKEHSSIYGEVKLIVGANDNDKKNPGVEKMFIPDASTFGFMTDFSFGFNPSDAKPNFNKDLNRFDQRLAINLGVYYLGKKLQPDTLTSFNTSLFHIKLGIEYIIIPSALSVYFNTNHLLVTTNINNFEKYYADAGRVRSFTSFGMQSLLDLNAKKEFFLQVNLGFVGVNKDVNIWHSTTDSVIPNVKLTLVKKL